MVPDRFPQSLRLGGRLLLGGLLLWVFFRIVLSWTFPLLAGFCLSALLERPISGLIRLGLPRWAAAGCCVVLLCLLLSGGLALLLWRLWREAERLYAQLPALLSALSAVGADAERWTARLLVAAPPDLRPALRSALGSITAQVSGLTGQFSAAAARQSAAVLADLPRIVLALFTTALAAYFSAAGYPALVSFLWRQIPEGRRSDVRAGLNRLRAAAAGWLRAQGLLALLTFVLLTAGFLLLGVETPVLPAAVTAVLDALPVLGAGLILLPWALVALLTGDLAAGLGLLGLWGVILGVRSLMEPRLVGRHAGLPPLAALAAMYIGLQAFGVPGMVLAPLALLLAKALQDAGLLTLWQD